MPAKRFPSRIVGQPGGRSRGRAERWIIAATSSAFGVLLYEMLVGKPPFDGPMLHAVMTAMLTRPAPSVRRARGDVPAGLERMIGRCLERDPARRLDG